MKWISNFFTETRLPEIRKNNYQLYHIWASGLISILYNSVYCLPSTTISPSASTVVVTKFTNKSFSLNKFYFLWSMPVIFLSSWHPFFVFSLKSWSAAKVVESLFHINSKNHSINIWKGKVGECIMNPSSLGFLEPFVWSWTEDLYMAVCSLGFLLQSIGMASDNERILLSSGKGICQTMNWIYSRFFELYRCLSLKEEKIIELF